MVLQLDIETDLLLFIFLFTVTVYRLQSVSLYPNLLLLLYCTPLTYAFSISIPLSVSVYGDVRSCYCSLSLLHLIHYYLLFFFSSVQCTARILFSSVSTVSLLFLCQFFLCLLYRRSHSFLFPPHLQVSDLADIQLVIIFFQIQ